MDRSTLLARIGILGGTKYMFNEWRFGKAHTTSSIALHDLKRQPHSCRTVTLVKWKPQPKEGEGRSAFKVHFPI